MDYCKVCRRHLNGALSCPGCGATGIELSSVQDVRSTVSMPRVGDRVNGAEPPPELVPTSLIEPETALSDHADDGDDADHDEDAADAEPGRDRDRDLDLDRERESITAEAVVSGSSGSDSGSSDSDDATAIAGIGAGIRDGYTSGGDADPDTVTFPKDESGSYDSTGERRSGRRGQRRRGVGLMVTGGCAGIAVVGFLIFGSGGHAPTPAPATSTSAAPPSSAGPTPSTLEFATTSLSPSPSASSAAPTSSSPSPLPTRTTVTASQAPTTQAPPPSSAAPTSAKPSVTASRTAKPSQSPSCFIIVFC